MHPRALAFTFCLPGHASLTAAAASLFACRGVDQEDEILYSEVVAQDAKVEFDECVALRRRASSLMRFVPPMWLHVAHH